jgi:hypothetical protein
MKLHRPSSQIEEQLKAFEALSPQAPPDISSDDFARKLPWDAWKAHQLELQNELEEARALEARNAAAEEPESEVIPGRATEVGRS